MHTGSTPHAYRRLFAYERDSHATVVNSLEGVPLELRDTESYQKAVGLLAHIATSRRLWLYRFGAIPDGPSHLFPEGSSLEDATALLDEVQHEWVEWLERLTHEDLRAEFDYTSLDGSRFRNSVDDILVQLYGHSLYHRGQIALLLRAIGCEPPITDFVFWARKPLDTP